MGDKDLQASKDILWQHLSQLPAFRVGRSGSGAARSGGGRAEFRLLFLCGGEAYRVMRIA